MTLRVVGAGLGRTGTNSLKLALEHLLGGPCYHMLETLERPDDIQVWHRAVDGEMPDWDDFFRDYVAGVDWPVAGFWRELADAFPDAIVLLSVRDADAWWKSADDTIFRVIQRAEVPPDMPSHARAHGAMVRDLLAKRFTPDWTDAAKAKAAYEQHNAEVRAEVAPGRLVEWHPGEGWEPICGALGLAIPDAPFPHVNTTADFRARIANL